MSECCSFAPEEAKKEEYTVYTDELEYSRAAEPPVQCGVSHLSRRTEPHCL